MTYLLPILPALWLGYTLGYHARKRDERHRRGGDIFGAGK